MNCNIIVTVTVEFINIYITRNYSALLYNAYTCPSWPRYNYTIHNIPIVIIHI